ncbi:MAG: BTAD domain-containing putative transcriptional regulator [Thermodesulfobacteriota bacterium]|nr:BTAD domain-containing putative transcriptional regulator [Thermodesulfobacteriota bacterium]
MASRSSSLAKLARPALSRVFLRERTFDLLDRLRQQPVIWISGPAGCGKTTLASSYIETRRLPCLWYRLDRGDGDAATFFYYLGLAAKKVSPRAKTPLPLLTPEYLRGMSTFALRYFEKLYQRLRNPSVLVFDNYHEVSTDSPFHEIIYNGLSNIPEGINVFLISRQDPHPALISLEANHLMGILRWNELRLTLKESSGIASARFREKFSKKTLQQIHSLTDGWAVGLILLLERFKRERTDPPRIEKSKHEEIFNYFSSEILNLMDPETQDFLLKTSFLPQMTESMVERLTENPRAGWILNRLNRGNYFTEKRVLDEPVYGYHPLFREYLLSRAEESFSEQSLSLLRSRAADLLEEHGQVGSAARLLQEIRDWDTLIQLILKHAPVMHAQGRDSVLEKWLQSIPPESLETQPWLSYWMGSCRLFANPAQSRPHFEQAYRQMRMKKDATGLFLAWSGMVDAVNLGYGFESFSVLDRYLQDLDELRQDYPVFPSPEIEVRVSSTVVAALVLRQPDHPEIEAWVERVLRLAKDPTLFNAKAQSLFFLAYYHNYRGDREKARLAIDQMRQLSQSPHASPFVKVMTLHIEAMHDCIFGLNQECLQAVRVGLELSQRTGISFLYHGWFAFGGFAAFQMNDLNAGRGFLKQMASCQPNLRPLDTTYYHLLQVNEALFSGNVLQASLHAELALKIALDSGSPALTIRCLLVKARTLHEIGSGSEALKHLKQAADLSRRMKIEFGTFCCLFTKAQFEFDRGEEKTGRIALRKALSLGKERGFMGIFIDRPTTTARVCMKALEDGIEVDYVREMIRERNLMPEQPPWHLENWPWPLKIFTLGRFALLKDDRSVRFTKKIQQKPLALLKALIAFGGREVGEHQLTDALWPEVDGDLAHQSFASNLHRLRQLLGFEKAILRQENHLTLDEKYCWVDIRAFEHLLERADVQWRAAKTGSAVELIEKALGFYKGPFLGQEVEQPWSMGISERLRSMFLRSVKKLGTYWMEGGQLEKALECYQKGLEVDRLAEEFYQDLMTCYYQLGRQTEAISTYNRCKRALLTGLGIEPSFKTEALYKTILTPPSPS